MVETNLSISLVSVKFTEGKSGVIRGIETKKLLLQIGT